MPTSTSRSSTKPPRKPPTQRSPPNNKIPLAKDDRARLFLTTRNQPARATRLELSPLGGTLDAVGRFPNFEWDHRAVLGRDMHVRTLAKGVMYPFGHRAEFLQIAERIYDPAAGGAAVLRWIGVLTIVEPVRRAPGDGKLRRAFPFGDVEITRTVFTDLANPVRLTTLISGQQVGTHFWPKTLAGSKVQFPVACSTTTGVLNLALPMLFVDDLAPDIATLTSPDVAKQLALEYAEAEVRIPATDIDLVGGATSAVGAAAAAPKKGDIQEVRALKIAGVKVEEGLSLADGYRSKLTELEIGLPALRSLLGEDPRTRAKFAPKYLQNGAEDVLLEMVKVDIDFSESADKSGGLVAPKFETNGISRSMGPVDRSALPDPGNRIHRPHTPFPIRRCRAARVSAEQTADAAEAAAADHRQADIRDRRPRCRCSGGTSSSRRSARSRPNRTPSSTSPSRRRPTRPKPTA